VAEIPRNASFCLATWIKLFSLGKSQAETLVQYIASQVEHHRKISFQDELQEILRKYGVAFDERYLWD